MKIRNSINSSAFLLSPNLVFYFLVKINCSENTFNCTSGTLKCIPWLWVCDGDGDCEDRSDEAIDLCGLLLISICKFFSVGQ